MVDEAGAPKVGHPPPAASSPDDPPHHRDIQGGLARAAVFGASDGLVSNVSLILGVAGATTAADIVQVAGVAGLVSGAVSMAAGEWISMQAQRELFERELAVEREQIRHRPHAETAELSAIYQARGADPDLAHEFAQQMMRDPEQALEIHAREELGISPDGLGSPLGAAVSSFLAFSVGALIPLLPWFFLDGMPAVVWALSLAGAAAAGLGLALATFTGRSKVRSALRQVAIAGGAATITYAIGSVLDVST